MAMAATAHEPCVNKEDFRSEACDVWFEVNAMARPDHFGRRLTMLAKPEFDVHDIYESGIIEKSDGHYRAHWHCRLTAHEAVDEFAVLRFLKLLTGSGFRILRFDNAFPGVPPWSPAM